MTDGLNDARALRIAEIMADFRSLQHYIAQIRVSPSAEEYYLQGFALLRQCVTEARAILAAPFSANTSSSDDANREKAQLKVILLDASVRRFRCQRVYLRATAGMRWVNSRHAVIQGGKMQSASLQVLQRVDNALRAELATITDEYVAYCLRTQDVEQGKWLDEDPSLSAIQRQLNQHQ
ncbi:uncharacterized protein K452DRAFT_328207 [Aplosporella prunicola CBS 121167]|uniref:Fungal N-terminal domain-containing protein n=1 Tax=Aplosporella prunicola CBS 121167 TaxID=1176127 RepID=A0A6A6B9Y1_9PEZI|nr:uncharacterized protein K452DRAFT_328207 [Aplosporella prunicola CBS 121167]KAF2139301.1 hypothetical protein K452DRAFT_328207 [Aplosporella prunicola CBS 121167]